jgi:hypothetical protein
MKKLLSSVAAAIITTGLVATWQIGGCIPEIPDVPPVVVPPAPEPEPQPEPPPKPEPPVTVATAVVILLETADSTTEQAAVINAIRQDAVYGPLTTVLDRDSVDSDGKPLASVAACLAFLGADKPLPRVVGLAGGKPVVESPLPATGADLVAVLKQWGLK